MLPEQAIAEYQELYDKKYGVKLSKEEATEKAYQLFNLMKSLTKDVIDSPSKQ